MAEIRAFAEPSADDSLLASAASRATARQYRESGSTDTPTGRDRAVVSSAYLHRLQRRHFVLFDVLPVVATIAALAILPLEPPGRIDLGLFAAMWLVTGLGLTVGFHRLFSHRSFATSDAVRVAAIVAGSMAGRGPMVSWVAMHRRHHQCADHEGDLHSPNLHGESLRGRLLGFIHAQWTWMFKHDYPNVALYVPDLLADPLIVWTNRQYYWWVALGLAVPAALGGLLSGQWMGVLTGLLWGGLVRMFVVAQTMSAINSCFHAVGWRSFDTQPDNSRNCGPLSLLTWGEAWHNNHHAFPYSAALGLRWYQLDPGFWLIRGLQAAGLAWNVKVPEPAKIAEKKDASFGAANP